MRRLFNLFVTDRLLFLVSSILLCISVGTWVLKTSAKFKTEATPWKPGCNLACLPLNNQQILNPCNEVINTADYTITLDYLFILTYVIAFTFIIMALNYRAPHEEGKPIITKTTIIACWLVVVAGLLDLIENIFLLEFIHNRIASCLPSLILAVIKFSLLIALLIYAIVRVLQLRLIPKLFRWPTYTGIGHGLKSARIYLPGLLTVIISYFVFSKLPQGQDVIIQVSEFWGPFIWAGVCIFIWAMLCWYSSRLVGYEKSMQPGANIPEEYHTHVPRLIAYNCLVSVQAAILALPTIGNLPQSAIWAFIIIQNALYFFRHKVLTTTPKPVGYVVLSWIIITAYFLLCIYLTVVGCNQHEFLLPWLAFGLFILQLVLMIFFVRRRKRMTEIKTTDRAFTSIGSITLWGKKIVDVPLLVQDSEQVVFRRILIIFVYGFMIYVAAMFFPFLDDRMGPFAIAVLSFGILVAISNIITIVSLQVGINLFAVLFVWAIILGNLYNPYSVRTVSLKDSTSAAERPTMKTYVERWLQKRQVMIDSSDNFPVYLVIADGGASRSGYWVASVLSEIQERTESNPPGNAFADHLLVLAGASGGSVGNATFYALMKNNLEGPVAYKTSAQNFLAEDFLSPVLSRWLGSDLFKHIIPMPVDDRGTALANGMEYFSDRHLKGAFSKPFTQVIDNTGCLPILFINTTNVQEGTPAVVSSVRLDPFSKRIDVLDYLAKMSSKEMHDLKFSTGVVMGARFPYVSPAGNIGNKSFVDGGYFDNTGAGILHEMMQVLGKEIDNNNVKILSDTTRNRQLLNKLKFQLIYLRNSSLDSTTTKVMHPLVNDAAAPIITVLGTYGSQTEINNLRLKRFMESLRSKGPSIDMNLYRKKSEPEFPMNWVISKYNLGRMDSNLVDVMNDEFDHLIKIPQISAKCNCRVSVH